MRALVWCDTHKVQVDSVDDPKIVNPRDIIVKVTSTAICGSDLHLYNGFIPMMAKGDVLGHEFMGEVVEVGSAVTNLKVGDRVVNPFTISCGDCYFCKHDLYSACDNTNPTAGVAEKMLGYATAGFFGYSHIFGGYAGGQAQYARIPFGDVGPMKVPEHLSDEQVLFLSDILPTGYMAAENAEIQTDDVVAVWGCGPVGLFAIESAWLFNPSKVIAIDRIPERLEKAAAKGCVTIDYTKTNVLEELKELTGGRGPDRCIDAVGMEAHGMGLQYAYDKTKQVMRLENDRPIVLREAIMACRKAGTISLIGVYSGLVDKIPMGAAFNKGLTLRMGQTHMKRYMKPLLDRIEKGEIDSTFVISHTLPLEEAPHAYKIFNDKKDRCTKVILKPH